MKMYLLTKAEFGGFPTLGARLARVTVSSEHRRGVRGAGGGFRRDRYSISGRVAFRWIGMNLSSGGYTPTGTGNLSPCVEPIWVRLSVLSQPLVGGSR